jgi:predicted TIM-barrel fold metal-dependent hydrolase
MKTVFERVNDFEIIDFHTHPFFDNTSNICAYKDSYKMGAEDMELEMRSFGISRMVGGVIRLDRENFEGKPFEKILAENRDALKLRDLLGGFYVPAFQIHPDFIEESIEEIRFMKNEGVRLIGELVPYHESWERYDHEGLHPIFEEAEKAGMAVDFHTMALDSIESMVKAHPGVTFIAAHPGEKDQLLFHIDLMKKYENLCLDISGTGIFRYHALAYAVKEVGSERIFFGSDYPVCNPGVYVGGLLAEPLSDRDFENIFSLNAKRILGI